MTFMDIYNKIPKQVFFFFFTLMFTIGAGTLILFGFITEEFINSCMDHKTFLQSLSKNFAPNMQQFCSNTREHNYLSNSIAELATIGGNAYLMIASGIVMRYEYQRRKGLMK